VTTEFCSFLFKTNAAPLLTEERTKIILQYDYHKEVILELHPPKKWLVLNIEKGSLEKNCAGMKEQYV
jgi:hypothetical protein